MDIVTQKELLVDAIHDKQPTITIEGKNLSQLVLFSSIYKNQSSNPAFDNEESSALLTHIAKQNPLTGKDCISLALLPDHLSTQYITSTLESHNVSDEKIASGLAALIKKAQFNSISALLEGLDNQGIKQHHSRSYTMEFCQAGNNLRSRGGNTQEAEKALVGIMQKLPWDVDENINGRDITSHFQSYDLATVYDYLSREMADSIKKQSNLDSEAARDKAGQAINVRGSL